MSDSTIYKYNKQVRASSRLELLRQDAKDANTITGLAVWAVGQGNMELLATACDADRQLGNRIDTYSEAINPELGGAA